MSNPRRRSTRLVNTPKIDYEEQKIELKPISSKKKKTDEHQSKNDDKNFKRIKLRHEIVTTELFVSFNHDNFQDDEDTIISSSAAESSLLERSFLDTSVDDTTTRYKLNDETNSKNDINFVSNELTQQSVDSQGFLIPDDTNTNLPSSQDNQNIIDVTDYDKFFDLDESTIENCVDNTLKDNVVKSDKKRIKKFVKKQKPKQSKILTNFVTVSRKTLLEDSQATEILNENLTSNQLSSPEKTPTKLSIKKQDNLTTKDVSFVDFFKTENLSKPSIDKESELVEDVKIIQTTTDQLPKRKRGRPRKSDVQKNTAKTSNDNQELLKPIALSVIEKNPIIVDSSDDFDVIEIKKSEEVDISKNLSSSPLIELDKEDEVVLMKTDEPWTVKYRPLCGDEILDNEAASNKIKEWIDDFIRPDNRYYDDDSEASCLETCALIYGPTGCGKTALVYALAEELNYKVFEINCSSRRNGKFINQIKEATLSHTVSRKSTSNSQSPVKTPKQTGKQADSKQKTLFNFFQKKKPIDQLINKPPSMDESSFSQETVNNLKSLSINSNSLILIDDVDIIFEEDTGFWQALQILIENTKRPIILTATNFLKNIKQEVRRSLCVQMNYPAKDKLKAYLEQIVAKECYESSRKEDVEILADHIERIKLNVEDHHCDIRSCLNRLQFDFSSVNIFKNEESIMQPSSANDHVNNQSETTNELIEFNAKNYNNLILSDLLSSNFQINSRNELDNSCFIDDNYQVKDLKASILVEFNRLNDKHQPNLFKTDLDDYRLSKIDWSNAFHKCRLEIDRYFVHLASKENLFCDYLPYLSSIMNLEEERFKLFQENTRRAKRFLPYLDGLNVHLSDEVKQFLTKNYLNH